MTTAAGSYITIVFSVGVMGVNRDLTVIVLSGVHRVFSDSAEVTVLQLVSTDMLLSGEEGAVGPGFPGRLLRYPKRSVGLSIV